LLDPSQFGPSAPPAAPEAAPEGGGQEEIAAGYEVLGQMMHDLLSIEKDPQDRSLLAKMLNDLTSLQERNQKEQDGMLEGKVSQRALRRSVG
jgi:hypothetical protein